MTSTARNVGAPTRPPSLPASSVRALVRTLSSGVQEGSTPGTVDFLQFRAADMRKAKSWRTRLASLFIAKPCPYVEGLPAPESSPRDVAASVVTAAGLVLSVALIIVAVPS